MSPIGWILLLAVIVIAAVAIYYATRVLPSRRLRSHFGPEYDDAVARLGDRKRAEAELALREMRVAKLNIRELTPQERDEFKRAWLEQQAAFVDEPAQAVADSDRLIARVMEARGYPVRDFEQQAADISVQHPHVVREYRLGHAIELARQDGRATTEDLRQALVHYRALFSELVGEPLSTPSTETGARVPVHSAADNLETTKQWR